MEDHGKRKAPLSRRIAFGGMLTALGVTFLLLAGTVPVMIYAAPLAASVLLTAEKEEFGRKDALSVWLSTAVLTFLLGADKEGALFYAFFGWLPAAKDLLDRLRPALLRVILKAVLFAVLAAGMYALIWFVLRFDAGLEEIFDAGAAAAAAFLGALVLVLLLYDALLGRAAALYRTKIRPYLKFLR